MIPGSKKNFFKAHWDWLVAGFGLLALAAGIAVVALPSGGDMDEDEEGVSAAGGKKGGIEEADLAPYRASVERFSKPGKVVEPAETTDSYLASGRRVFCEQGDATSEKKACGRPIPFGLKVCPFADCGAKQPEEAKVAVDSDGDGLFDEWEKQYGLNPNDATDATADKDGDGFTNTEECEAKTDPSDPASHPDYRDSLQLALPLKQVTLPFYFEKVVPLPGGAYRFYFKDPTKKNDYGKPGKVYNPRTDEEIGTTGFIVKGYEKKTEKREIAGDKNMKRNTREVDVSTATLERKTDRKTVVMTVNRRNTPIDTQAKLVYTRGAVKELMVSKGGEIDLNGTKFTIDDIVQDGKKVTVTVGNATLGKKTIEALEQ